MMKLEQNRIMPSLVELLPLQLLLPVLLPQTTTTTIMARTRMRNPTADDELDKAPATTHDPELPIEWVVGWGHSELDVRASKNAMNTIP